MTPTQEDILDELYFVTSFAELQKNLGLDSKTLGKELKNLLAQEYIKSFFPDPDTELPFQEEMFEENAASYFYLATKKGLLAHNSR